MENNIDKDVLEIIKISKEKRFYTLWDEVYYRIIFNMFEKCIWFKSYIIYTNNSNMIYWYTYIFWLISNYINKCHIEDKPYDDMLNFLNEWAKTDNKDEINVLCTSVLEIFDQIDDLKNVVKRMPDSLKTLFMDWYPHYLDSANVEKSFE